MHRWTAIFLPPIRISIFEQDIAMLRYIKTSDMCKKCMKSLPVNVNPLAKPCISACVRRFKTETNEKKKATHPRLAFFSLQRVAMYFIWWENASLPPYSLQPVALYKGVQILESGKFLLAELGILALENHANDWNSESKFYWQKIRNPVPGTRNRYKDLNPESKFHWHRLESSTWNPGSTAWNPESKTVLDSLTWGRDGSQLTIFSATQRCSVGTTLQPFEAMLQQCCNAVLR